MFTSQTLDKSSVAEIKESTAHIFNEHGYKHILLTGEIPEIEDGKEVWKKIEVAFMRKINDREPQILNDDEIPRIKKKTSKSHFLPKLTPRWLITHALKAATEARKEGRVTTELLSRFINRIISNPVTS